MLATERPPLPPESEASKQNMRLVEGFILGERRACAALVRAAGCLCGRSGEDDGEWVPGLEAVEHEACEVDEPLRVKVHNPSCPQALAAAIEARQ